MLEGDCLMNRKFLILSQFFTCLLIGSSLSMTWCSAAEPTQIWLATVSVSEYPKLAKESQLSYCDNDAKAIIERFAESKCVIEDRLCRLQSGESNDFLPTQANIQRELPRFLSKPKPEDMVVLFFSMHGAQAKDGRTFLLPSDVESDPERGGSHVIPMDWLRQEICNSPAKRIVLFLDACHAGGISAPGNENANAPLSSKNIEVVFQQAASQAPDKQIYVVASCRDNQASLETPLLEHGVFTHWLTCGLDGAADSNSDSQISMDELFSFVEKQVPKSAAYLSRLEKDRQQRSAVATPTKGQNPVRFFFGQDHGDIQIMPIAAKSIHCALDRVSEMLDVFLRSHLYEEYSGSPARVGIVEFGLQGPDGSQELRGSLGSFGSMSRDIIDRKLTELNQSTKKFHQPVYRVTAGRTLKSKLQEYDVNNIESLELPSEVLQKGDSIDVLLCGRYLRRGGSKWDQGPDRLELDLTLIDTRRKDKIARIQSVILVNRELLAMLGHSIDDRQPPTSPASQRPQHGDSLESQADHADGNAVAATNQHPQFSPQDSTLAIRIHQNAPSQQSRLTPWLPRNPSDPNTLAFETKEGNELALEIRNNTDEHLAFVLQIDGVNQIGRSVASPDRSPYWQIKPRSTAWISQWLDELDDSQVQGLIRTLNGKRLVIVSAPQSVAAQRKATESLGEIRVIVYGTRSKDSRSTSAKTLGLGVGEGTSSANRYPVFENIERNVADQRAIYVMRYQAESPGKISN
jgi:hypothetical protein